MACYTGKITVKPQDPRINYNLLPGEKLLTCPYNKSHALLPIKFAKHVTHCHGLHVKEQALKNEKPLYSICRYDVSHHVRNEELASHESQCQEEMEKDAIFSWDDVGEAMKSFESDVKAAPPQKPTPIDEETMKAICGEEDWEADLEAGPAFKFDRQRRIQELRLAGYNVVNTLDNVGLTKSEKKAFYKAEDEAMKTCAQIRYLDQMKNVRAESGCTVVAIDNAPASTSMKSPSSTPSVASMYGYDMDISLGSIREEEK